MHAGPRLAAALLLPALAAAQSSDGPYWNSRSLPGPLTQPVVVIGSVAVLQTKDALHLYSSVLRRWTRLPISATATVHAGFNDYVVVRDGAKVHGYSTRTGKVATVTVTPAATVFPGPPGRGWVAAVHDGRTVYGFSGFHGAWVPVRVATATPTVSVGGNTILVGDGVRAHAFSMMHGTWVSTPSPSIWNVKGKVALAFGTGPQRDVLAYSGHTNRWSAHAFPNPSAATLTLQKGFALLVRGRSALAFSGYRGTFASFTGSAALGTASAGPNVAVFQDGVAKVVGYAAGTGAFSTLAVAPPAALQAIGRIYGSVAVVTAAGNRRLYGFSGITGRFTAALGGSFRTTLSQVSAFAKGSPNSYAYSPLLDRWVQAPKRAFTATHMVNPGVVLEHPAGFEAFDIRSGRWVSRQITPGRVQTQGSIFANLTGNRIDVFDGRLGRWTAVTTAGAPQLSLWRLTAVAADLRSGYGYSLLHGSWDRVALKGAVQTVQANSEIGFVLTKTHIHLFTSFGTFSPIFTFPEFWRVQPRGTRMRLLQSARAGSVVITLVGTRPARADLGTHGVLFLDPAALFASLPLGIVPASGVLDLGLPIPADPVLNGVHFHMQDLVVDPAQPASWWVTNSLTPVLW